MDLEERQQSLERRLADLVKRVDKIESTLRDPGSKDSQEHATEVENDDVATLDVGVEWATLQCRELLDRGAPGIHFYTLNKSMATRAIFEELRKE